MACILHRLFTVPRYSMSLRFMRLIKHVETVGSSNFDQIDKHAYHNVYHLAEVNRSEIKQNCNGNNRSVQATATSSIKRTNSVAIFGKAYNVPCKNELYRTQNEQYRS